MVVGEYEVDEDDDELDDDQLLFLSGMDKAIVGVAFGMQMEERVVYDYEKVIEHLESAGLEYEDAIEFFDFNIASAWMGDHTPIFIRPCYEKEESEALGKMN